MKVNINIDIDPPRIPNFLLTKDGKNSIPIQNLPDKTLREIGKAWSIQLIKVAQSRRKKFK